MCFTIDDSEWNWLSSFTNLASLTLAGFQFQSFLLKRIQSDELEELFKLFNYFIENETRFPSSVSSLTSLTKLMISKIEGTFPTEVLNLTHLRKLRFFHASPFTGLNKFNIF